MHRRLAIRVAETFLAMLLLYIVSSGPVLRCCCGSDFDSISADQLRAIYTPDDAYTRRMRTSHKIQGCYGPLVRAASTAHLTMPLEAYLKMWDVTPMMWDDGSIVFFVLK